MESYRQKTSLPKKCLKILGVILVILLPAVAMTYKIMSASGIDCEVCMSFRGREQCRSAHGGDELICRTTATDNACAFIASGMTDSIACSQGQPTSFRILEKK